MFFFFFSRVVHTLNHNFRAATRIMRTTLGMSIKRNHVLVKILYAGVNASDVSVICMNSYCVFLHPVYVSWGLEGDSFISARGFFSWELHVEITTHLDEILYLFGSQYFSCLPCLFEIFIQSAQLTPLPLHTHTQTPKKKKDNIKD